MFVINLSSGPQIVLNVEKVSPNESNMYEMFINIIINFINALYGYVETHVFPLFPISLIFTLYKICTKVTATIALS